MASIKYRVKGKKELATIYIHLVDGRDIQLQVTTGYSVNPKYWNNSSGTVKASSGYKDKLNLSSTLDELKLFVLKSLNKDKDNGTIINSLWLKLVIKKFKNPQFEKKTEKLIERIVTYQESLKNKFNPKTNKPISSGTIRNFNTTKSRLKKFEMHKKKVYMLLDIDLTFLEEFSIFLKVEAGLSQNSVSNSIKNIKTVCLDAQLRGYSINQQVQNKNFYQAPEATTFQTLTVEEIDKIIAFKGSNYLENARDWFVIGCWTGCRVSDLMKLTMDNVFTNQKGQKYISHVQGKTGKKLNVFLYPPVEEILKRREGFPKPISQQKLNVWIKDVCRESGLKQIVQGSKQNAKTKRKEEGDYEKWQLLSSHDARRTFATNHYKLLSNKQIMSATGHSTEKVLLAYIGKVDDDDFDAFANVWEVIQEESSKIINTNKAK